MAILYLILIPSYCSYYLFILVKQQIRVVAHLKIRFHQKIRVTSPPSKYGPDAIIGVVISVICLFMFWLQR